MANEIRLVTYANQQVTPQNDAVLTNLEILNNGIIFGCEVTIKNASTLHINSGMGVIYGREFEIVDSDISVPLPGAGTELGQLYIHIDLANTSAPVQLLIETGASLTPLVDDANLNVTTGITEYQLATFNVSTATISDLVVTFENTKDIRSELGTADISGIGDGSVKGAISRINSDLTWKLLANKTGNTAINLPLTFKEIHIRVWMPTANLYVENNFLYEDFNRQTFRYLHSIGGWYYTSNNNGWCTLADQNGQIYLNSAFYSGTNITSECQIKVWYR